MAPLPVTVRFTTEPRSVDVPSGGFEMTGNCASSDNVTESQAKMASMEQRIRYAVFMEVKVRISKRFVGFDNYLLPVPTRPLTMRPSE